MDGWMLQGGQSADRADRADSEQGGQRMSSKDPRDPAHVNPPLTRAAFSPRKVPSDIWPVSCCMLQGQGASLQGSGIGCRGVADSEGQLLTPSHEQGLLNSGSLPRGGPGPRR